MSPRVLALAAVLAVGCTPKPTKTEEDAAVRPMPMPSPNVNVIVIPPKQAPATRLAVLLHGVGDSAAAFQDIGRALDDAIPRAELLVPDGFHPWDGGGSGRQWFSLTGITEQNRPARVREAGEEVSRFIDAELAKRGLSGDRLVLVGFSQGAMLASWLAVHRSPRPAAVVMLSGRVVESDVADVGAGPPVFVAHGAIDPVIPVSVVDPGVRRLEGWGARVTKRVYPRLAHHVDAQEMREVRDFLASNVDTR